MITAEQIANAIREERLQCAVEMCLEIAEDNLQWTCLEGLISETVGDSNLPASLVDLQRIRVNHPRVKHSLISVVSQALLEMPYCRRPSPMSIFEKSDLLEKARLVFPSGDPERLIIDEILHLVRSDESLSQIQLRPIAAELQGLILFLGHNDSPSRVLELKKDDFSGLASEGLMIAAFMVGLRFRRQTLASGQVFVPFRDTQILKVVAILNGATPPGSAEVRREGKSLFINNASYMRRSKFFVLQILASNLVVYGGAKGEFSKFSRVKLIAIKDLSSIGSLKIKHLPIPNRKFSDNILKSISFENFKLGKIRVFSNRELLDSYFDSEKFLEVKFKSEVWLHEEGELPKKLKNILLRFRLNDLKQILSNEPNSKRLKKSVIRKETEGQLSIPLTEDAPDYLSYDNERDLKYWKKDFKSLFKIKSIKM